MNKTVEVSDAKNYKPIQLYGDGTEVLNTYISDIANHTYHSSNGVSASSLIDMKQSPLHFYSRKFNKVQREETEAMRFGTAFHTALLEPEEFRRRSAVKTARKNSKEYKLWIQQLPHDHIIISEKEQKTLAEMLNVSANSTLLQDYLAGGDKEQTAFFRTPNGMLGRTRPDIVRPEHNTIIELKTADNSSFYKFRKSIHNRGYSLQAGWNCLAYEQVTGREVEKFYWVVIEKTPPYAYSVYEADEETLIYGKKEVEIALANIECCVQQKRWPSYNNEEIEVMDLPSFVV